MKHILIIVFFSVLTAKSFSQDSMRLDTEKKSVRPLAVGYETLPITVNYTTNLIFPYGIASVDIGSRDILAKKSGPGENVLLLKAGRRAFSPTNLSVYTKDGKLYSYQLVYADTLSVYNYSYSGLEYRSGKPFLHIKARQDGMTIRLTGVYSKDGLLWMVFQIRNHSPVDYFPASVRFGISDKKRTRKMVVQEENWEPLFAAQTPVWAAGSGDQLRYGFRPRTPDKKKEIVVEWADQNGERRIKMRIPVKLLLMARSLP